MIDKCVRYGLFFVMSVILAMLLMMNNAEYACKLVLEYTNISMLIGDIIVLTVLLGVGGIVLKREIRTNRIRCNLDFNKVIALMTVLLFIFEVYIAYNIHFKTGWDVGNVWNNANRIAFEHSENLDNGYFSQNPNNLLITLIQTLILKINAEIGVFHGDDTNMILIVVNCMCISLTCFLVYKILKRFVSVFFAFAGFMMTAMLAGLSPWLTICYTDVLGILFPVLIIYIFMLPVSCRIKNIMRYGSIILLSSFGYYIKPQILIVTIAVFIIELVHAMKKANKKELAVNIIVLFVMICCLAGGGKCIDSVCGKVGFELNDEARFGMTHYFMMGLNKEHNGVWAGEDVERSAGCETVEERRKANIEVSIQRLQDFGLAGYAKHLSKKMLCVFNDGTFAWGCEGGFFQKVYEEPNERAASWLRSFYYMDGINFDKFATFAQGIWLGVLFLVLCAAVWDKSGANAKYTSMIMLSILGITLFEVLFEARARYLFIYVPFYCMIASIGMHEVWIKLNEIVKNCINSYYSWLGSRS